MESTDPSVTGQHETQCTFVKTPAHSGVNNSIVFCSLMPPVITPPVRQTQQFSSKFTRAAICPQAPGGAEGLLEMD